MNWDEAAKLAHEVRAAYESSNARMGRAAWSASDYAAGLAGDVGDLIKLVMAFDGKRSGEVSHDRLAHELSDCLWSIFVIAERTEVDLAAVFPAQMKELLARVGGQVLSESGQDSLSIVRDVADHRRK